MIDADEVARYVRELLNKQGLGATWSKAKLGLHDNRCTFRVNVKYEGKETQPQLRVAATSTAVEVVASQLRNLAPWIALDRAAEDPEHYEGDTPRPDIRGSFILTVYVRGANEEKAEAVWRRRDELLVPAADVVVESEPEPTS
ncbi:hypothetical protein [Nannocystis pusilla]|uniref:hypothetical protein n=1 Tax=Nannocystis pusilla TaxID=889268 RepID=UPI003BF1A1DE